MTRKQDTTGVIDVKALLDGGLSSRDGAGDRGGDARGGDDRDAGAEKGERTSERLGYRSGYYTRTLITRVGTLELRVP